MDVEFREHYGQLVRKVWVMYCRETGDAAPTHLAPWEELSEWDKEADRRIGAAVMTAVCFQISIICEHLAAETAYTTGKSPQDALMTLAERLRRMGE